MSLGGHTVTFGNVISVIGLVSIVVDTGLSAQAWKDALIKIPAQVNPVITTNIQNSREDLVVVEM